MASYQTLTNTNFGEVVSTAELPVVVDFWAPWCGPCKAVAPALEELAAESTDKIIVGKVNVDDHPELAQQFGVMGIPTFIVFEGGAEAHRFSGAMSGEALAQNLAAFL